MDRLPLVVLALMLAGCAGTEPGPAPGRIDGGVLGHMAAPYANVTVTLEETGATTRTNDLGGFTFRNLPPGLYNVTTAIPGAGGDRETVRVQSGKVTRIVLQVEPEPEPEPLQKVWTGIGATEIALPGDACRSCTLVITDIGDRPDRAEVAVRWTAMLASETPGHVVVDVLAGSQLLTTQEPLIAPGDGEEHLLNLDTADWPQPVGDLELRVTFGRDVVPQPSFRMDMAVRMTYA